MELAILFGILLFGVTVSSQEPSGSNTCTKSQSYTQTEIRSERKSYQSRYTTWCFSLPPRCTRYRTYYFLAYKTYSFTKYKTVRYCCSGYKQAGTVCKPYCPGNCAGNGICTSPAVCSCYMGWGGSTCSTMCAQGFYGKGCLNKCECKNGATCDRYDGGCICKPGWKDKYCQNPCDDGKYGKRCQENCNCKNGAKCQPVDGACNCLLGYKGTRCEEVCTGGTWGDYCKQKCSCMNGAKCVPANGTCICTPGWAGSTCGVSCQQGWFGQDCKQKCNCKNGAKCNPVDGSCICTAGYKGKKCDEVCSGGTWGVYCSQKCSCLNKAKCQPTSGQCICTPALWKRMKIKVKEVSDAVRMERKTGGGPSVSEISGTDLEVMQIISDSTEPVNNPDAPPSPYSLPDDPEIPEYENICFCTDYLSQRNDIAADFESKASGSSKQKLQHLLQNELENMAAEHELRMQCLHLEKERKRLDCELKKLQINKLKEEIIAEELNLPPDS